MNTFGSAATRVPLYDARSTIRERMRFRRSAIAELANVNHFYAPSGRYSAHGWLLLSRSDYNRLDNYSTELQLEIHDRRKPDNVGMLKNLAIVQARCVTRGLASDPDALYLVEITDGRGILHNQWFSFPLTAAYNIRAPAYPDTFHPSSMNAGTTWTWSTMLQNIWNTMSSHLGAWPGLPITPAGTPEGFWFTGVPAWNALCDVLDHLGFSVAYDPTSDTPYTIVSGGTADAAFDALTTRYANRLEEDSEWIDVGSARVPAFVKVLFRRRNSYYGTEETVRYDSLQWDMTPHYSVTVNAPTRFSDAVGTHHFWSDFTVRYDADNNPLAADVTTATAIANERVTQYFASIYDATLGRMNRTYTGALPFKTGSRVDGVCWYMDNESDTYSGWRTQLIRGVNPPWPQLLAADTP